MSVNAKAKANNKANNRFPFSVTPAMLLPPHVIADYWEALAAVHPFLPYRFNDIDHPTPTMAMAYSIQPNPNPPQVTYFITPTSPASTGHAILAECTVQQVHNTYSAQLHFSFLPRTPLQTTLYVCRETLRRMFKQLPYRSYIGVTPTKNTPALALLRRIPFRFIATIPGGAWHPDSKGRPRPCDAQLTLVTEDDKLPA